ncbi:hypothetical protein Dthio_PD1919 [Desulfonatronospira thiodismutans ASO3-1]|uniref:Lipopolysaccharide assembly protein A domain-containing protein n=1 Tax=Desulfonatronospira thiodismutans ASO3-1 TaxID=555779 RepID=D6SP71_9BACT|nr:MULTISPECIES: lipopolysaccharide assembly protein LapA domain-containing protein [Desulfonatronospira]EFI34547.1 hypothetical protein Dthio_PD1919 [Desulfonatronospira thiodismutans ASO3-1]RQD75142.1 MAG: DUF1049 domain-containing protein [Desulfonatronospira sp. MSAO_Bac3]
MNAFRLIFLLLVFAAVMLGLSQNTETLGLKAPLELDLWFIELSLPQVAMYVFIFFCFLLGIIFGIITFFPANREAREKLKVLRKKLRLLQEDFKTAEMERARQIMKRQEKISPDEEAFKEEIVSSASSRAWGKAAMAGCVVLFFILVALYYYGHTEFEKVHEQTKANMEKTTGMIEDTQSSLDSLEHDFRDADKKLGELDREFREETAKLQDATENMQEKLQKHSGEISELKLIPVKTRDYLTVMHLEQYLQTLGYLKKEADTEEDRKRLQEAAEEVRKALEHYREKSD